MIVRVYYDHDALFIDGIRQAIVAGTLAASILGDTIAVHTINSDQPLAAGPYSVFARQDGSGFASSDECLAYLRATCARVLQRVPTVGAVAGEPIKAGAPVALSRADGTLRNARADTYPLSFLAGLAETDVVTGAAGNAVRSSIDLADWSGIAPTPTLGKGQRYFVGRQGGITPIPDLTTPGCVVGLGYASSPTTLVFQPSDPITL